MPETGRLGGKIRYLRRGEGLSQKQLAERLGISASYLNLIEHNQRQVTAALLIKVAQIFNLELQTLSGENEARLASDLLEAFGDPIFEGQSLTASEVRELAAHSPTVAQAVMTLYQAFRSSRESSSTLAARLSEGDELAGFDRSRLPSEEVTDLIQRHSNYFPELEAGAEALWRGGMLGGDLYEAMIRYLRESHGVEVVIEKEAAMRGAVRRFDPDKNRLILSEDLRRRNFQIGYQIGLLTQQSALERISRDPLLSGDESRALARVALASYFAAALLMPYEPFLEAARAERYDFEVLANRFRASFEQVCHRLTTLRRPGNEGVPFHVVRIDVAGNISKRFSASGLRFARFSGACPRWVVFSAFLTPGLIRTQISQMPDGSTYFWMARTLRRGGGGYHTPTTMFAIGLGCEVAHARELIYSDGVDLGNREAVVPVGITCRLCERMDCEQRAFPAMQHPLAVHENVRGISFYSPVEPR